MKRSFCLLIMPVCLLMALFLLSGCVQLDCPVETLALQEPAQGEKTIITYYDTTDGVMIANMVIDAYNAQSDDTFVELRIIENDLYDDAIAEMLRSGDMSMDCLFIRQPCQVNQFSAEGLLVDLTDRVAQSNLDPAGFGSTLDIITIENTIPALPRTKSVWLLFYNIDIFQRYGLGEPSNLTWYEYADLTYHLTTENEDGSTVYGGYIPPWTINIGAVAAGEYLYDDELPYTRKYAELLNRLYNTDSSHPSISQMEGEYSQPYPVFLEQKVATMINGDWVVLLFKNAFSEQSSAFRWGIATLPIFEDVPQMTSIGSCSYLAIPESCEHKDNAFDFLSFFSGSIVADMLAQLPTGAAYYTERIASIYQQSVDVPGTQYFFDSFVRNEEGAFVGYRELNQVYKDCILEYLRGNVTLDEAFENFERKRLPILRGE